MNIKLAIAITGKQPRAYIGVYRFIGSNTWIVSPEYDTEWQAEWHCYMEDVAEYFVRARF